MRRFNPYEYHTPPGWNPISSAPRDGTVIEIQNNYGVAPHFGLYKWHHSDWGQPGWCHAENPDGGGISSTDGLHLSWREYVGDSDNYRDPSGGEQNTRAYWIRACGLNPRDYPGSELSFDEEAAMQPARTMSSDETPVEALTILGVGTLALIAALAVIVLAFA